MPEQQPDRQPRTETSVTNAGELLPGTLDMLILRALARKRMHGYAIMEFIAQAAEGVLRIEEGALYPALHRMTARGWIEGEPGLSENKRRAKFYWLTLEGEKQLSEEAAHWKRLVAAIDRVMNETA